MPDDDSRPTIATLATATAWRGVAYRKIHLHGTEARRFAPGHAPAVVTVDGWRLGLAVCRDTGVLDHAAGIPEERAKRVIAEHGVWVATASFAGSADGGFAQAAGRSRIWNHEGEAAAAGPAPGEVVHATLTPAAGVCGRRTPRARLTDIFHNGLPTG